MCMAFAGAPQHRSGMLRVCSCRARVVADGGGGGGAGGQKSRDLCNGIRRREPSEMHKTPAEGASAGQQQQAVDRKQNEPSRGSASALSMSVRLCSPVGDWPQPASRRRRIVEWRHTGVRRRLHLHAHALARTRHTADHAHGAFREPVCRRPGRPKPLDARQRRLTSDDAASVLAVVDSDYSCTVEYIQHSVV